MPQVALEAGAGRLHHDLMTAKSPLLALPALMLALSACPREPPVEIHGAASEVQLRTIDTQNADGDRAWMAPLVVSEPNARYLGEGPLLAGTTACLTWGHDASFDDDPVPADCYLTSVEGPVIETPVTGGVCYEFGEGETTWTFEVQPCDAPFVIGDDEVTVRAVPGDDLEARFVAWPEALALWGAIATVASGDLPEDFGEPYGEVLLLAASQPVRLHLALRERESGAWAGWNPSAGSLELQMVTGNGRLIDGGEPSGVGWGWTSGLAPPRGLRVVLDQGAEAEVVLTVGDASWTVARLQAVAPSEADSLELVAARSDGTDVSAPLAARAFARTADGALIHGAPIRWSVTGMPMAVATNSSEVEVWGGADYVDLADRCQPPSKSQGERSAVLHARLGGLHAQAALSWDNGEAEEGEEIDDSEWERSEWCREPGCGGCAATGRGVPVHASLLLLLAALVPRRRRPPPRS